MDQSASKIEHFISKIRIVNVLLYIKESIYEQKKDTLQALKIVVSSLKMT